MSVSSSRASKVIFLIFSLLCLILILTNPAESILAVSRGLELCTRTVIPSLFPFMVISELLISCGAGETAGVVFRGPMRRLFGISGAASCSLFLGSVCGVPVGAKTAVSMYDKGILSKREVEHLLTFTNSPSSAFLISAVGVTLLSSRTVGIILYCVSFFSAALTGIIGRFILRPDSSGKDQHIGEHPYGCNGGIKLFTDAVTSSASSIITVCAYVLFFSAFIGTLSSLLRKIGVSPTVYALIYGIFEMSGGVGAAAAIPGRIAPAAMCAFICGWSGLSVHLQVMTVCGGRGISMKPYFIAKLAQGVLSATLVSIILTLAPHIVLPAVDVRVFSLIDFKFPLYFVLPTNIALSLTVLLIVFSKIRALKE